MSNPRDPRTDRGDVGGDRAGIGGRLFDVRQFITYLAVGLVGTVGHYATLVVLVRLVGVDPVAASACGFTVGAIINYFANYHLTFRSRKSHGRTMTQFFVVALLGLLVNTGVMALMTHGVDAHYLLAQVVATGVVVVLTYLGNRFWTFREVSHG